ncbi:puratrophin-1-like [Mustelus asterias]
MASTDCGLSGFSNRPDLELTCALYNQVDEEVHRLVQVSNQRQRDLEHLAEFWQFEEQFQKVSDWLRNMGQPQLYEHAKLADSLPALRKKQQEFRVFNQTALEYCQKAQGLLRDMAPWESAISPQLGTFAKRLQDSRRQLADFTQGAERCRLCIDRAIRLYEFFKMAYSWVLGTIRILAGISMDHCLSPRHCDTALASLRRLSLRHPEIPDSRFQEMRRLAEELGDPRCLQQWASCRAKCRESQAEAGRKLEAALGTCGAAQGAGQPSPGWLCQRWAPEGAAAAGQRAPGRRSPWPPGAASLSPSLSAASLMDDGSCGGGLLDGLEWTGSALSALSLASSSEGCGPDEWAGLPGRSSNLARSFSPVYASTPDVRGNDLPPPLRLLRRPPGSPRVVRRAQGGFPSPPRDHHPPQETLHGGFSQRSLSETGSDASGSGTGVLIRGLEVSSTEVVDRTCSPKEHVMLARAGVPLPDAPWGGPQATGSKPRHSLAEALAAEQEYVGSLAHVVENYFPEMDRPDVPQGLRGKRGVVFGNLEKLLAFHRHCLLPELRGCLAHPLRLGECFLHHKEHFSMYSLYVKNKPQSDALLTSHGNAFFERRQRFLGDRTDLASYLQKPVERMRSYSLLLRELSTECEAGDARELLCLRAATEMIQYQLRHGHNLLAMEGIQGCDVNLKEQGKLLRHDSFTVSCGRRKSTRHVFLFEQLIVFTKLKRADGVSETYIYKTSLKTADAGLTENIGDSGLRFEVWFRRRRRSNEAYVFQAESTDIKQAWTRDIAQILWRQASRNKELRLQEMVTMGMGSKLFLDVPCPASVVDPPAGGKGGCPTPD